MPPVRRRLWLELGLAVTAALLAVVTLISREWIEFVFGVDPDHGDGSAEWLVVAITATAAIVFALLTRVEWRRAKRLAPN